jgi:hypothetical protein
LSAENGPTPTICTDKALYFLGDTLECALSYWHYGVRIDVDVYVGLLTSSGIFLTLDYNYNWSPSIAPILKGYIVDPTICEEVFWFPFINFKLPMYTPTGLNFFLTVVTKAGSQNWASELNYVPFLIAPPLSTFYYVDVNTGVDKPLFGKKPNNPWKTITYALNQIGNPLQPVLLNVAQGSYSKNSGEKFPLKIPPKLYLRGQGALKTELNAKGSNAYHVIECNSKSQLPYREYFSTIIEGFHITGGKANGTTPDNLCGGGIFCNNFGMVIFQNNIIEGNEAKEEGGGIYISNSLAIIHHNTIQNNKANYGGAISGCNTIPETRILANTIIENTAEAGAGVYCKSGSQNIRNNLITKNVANENGGGIYYQSGDSLIANNLIKENKAEKIIQQGNNSESFAKGGGMYIVIESTPTIQNNAIIGNKAVGDNAAGGGIYCDQDSIPKILNNTIARNEAIGYRQIDLATDLVLGGQGGGIHCSLTSSSLKIKNCAIFKNIASHRGGGIRCQCASPEITNNMIRENISNGNGAGICCSNSSSNIKNNTIVENEAPNGKGGGFWSTQLPGLKIPTITDCIIYDNVTPTKIDSEIWTDHPLVPPLFCCIKNWTAGGTGNISNNPLFEKGPFGKYYLEDNPTNKSPCLDSGSQTASNAGLDNRTTITKKGSIDINIVDMGYHYLLY